LAIEGVDFVEIEEQARILKPDFLIGECLNHWLCWFFWLSWFFLIKIIRD